MLLFLSQNSIDSVEENHTFYTGSDTVKGGNLAVMNLAYNAGYTNGILYYMRTQYTLAQIGVYFSLSTLTIDQFGNIIPDPNLGYDANVAYVSGN